MLKLYGWSVCPHCHRAVAWLKEHKIAFEYLEIEEQPEAVIQQVIDVNGGEDWVVPTLEYRGQWQKGEAFDPEKFAAVMKRWELI